jgi:hypothetical protein
MALECAYVSAFDILEGGSLLFVLGSFCTIRTSRIDDYDLLMASFEAEHGHFHDIFTFLSSELNVFCF